MRETEDKNMAAKIKMRIVDFEGNYIERLVSLAEFRRISEYLMYNIVNNNTESTVVVTALTMRREQRARAKLACAFAKAKKGD
jgi:hypothetical protein